MCLCILFEVFFPWLCFLWIVIWRPLFIREREKENHSFTGSFFFSALKIFFDCELKKKTSCFPNGIFFFGGGGGLKKRNRFYFYLTLKNTVFLWVPWFHTKSNTKNGYAFWTFFGKQSIPQKIPQIENKKKVHDFALVLKRVFGQIWGTKR